MSKKLTDEEIEAGKRIFDDSGMEVVSNPKPKKEATSKQ